MKLGVTSDADAETGLAEVIYEVNGPISDSFRDRFYDDSGIGIFVVLMCRDPLWDFRQRIRFDKKRNTLYIDLMFDWHAMVESSHAARKRIVAEKMITQVPQIISTKKFKDFDFLRFTKDLREWFEIRGWLTGQFPEIIE